MIGAGLISVVSEEEESVFTVESVDGKEESESSLFPHETAEKRKKRIINNDVFLVMFFIYVSPFSHFHFNFSHEK